MESETIKGAKSERDKDLEWARAYAHSKQWRTAKNYQKTTPHEYIVVKWTDPHRDEFRRFFHVIEKYGKEETFFGKKWLYLYLGDGYKYFSANGGGWEYDRIVLNRCEEDKSYA